MKLFAVLACSLLLGACRSHQTLQPGEGFIPVKGGKVWYRILGSGDKTPVVLLHGGPGATSYYLNPMRTLATDRPVVYIDQLGCGRSDKLTDTSLMNTAAFVDELEQVRQALGMDVFYLYGHSWGTMLGMDYYLKYPARVKAMVIASPCLSAAMWEKDADTLIAALPDSVKAMIRNNRNYSSPEYKKGVDIYYQHYLTRLDSSSADMDSVEKQFGMNVYEYMWGPSEFTATGNLKSYDRVPDLPKVKVPVLFTAGEYDEARPSTVRFYAAQIPGAQFAVIPGSGHMTMQDNATENNRVVVDFLKEMDAKN
ncbi:MAG TPA: proline iminopeptidase-family hydrolase [Puia sp.]|nr:proline iminopeptidase-family hydrolase [Puia sp.]